MRVLILGINYAPEPIGIGPYTTGLAEALAEAGHDVRVVAGKPYYPAWRIADGYRRAGYRSARERGVGITRCPIYVPHRPSGARRILHHASFALTAAFPAFVAALRWRPDLVLCVAPSLMTAPVAKLAKRLAGARAWLHVQDFEVEAAFATGLIAGEGRVGRLALGFQGRALRGFDLYTSISPRMCEKLIALGCPADRVSELRNWADTSRVVPLVADSPFRREWDISAPHVALYSGNIANKQGIELVVEAARLLAHRQDIAFVVCGDGPQRKALVESATGLSNIHFHDLQPVERLGDLLGLATLHLLPQLAGTADLLLPSKLTNMLASGRPVLATAGPNTALADEVVGCGLVTPPGDATAFAGAMEQLADDAALRYGFGVAARQRAEQRWSKPAILGRLVRLLADWFEGGKKRPVSLRHSSNSVRPGF